jgi:PAS domain S-box-containing protein
MRTERSAAIQDRVTRASHPIEEAPEEIVITDALDQRPWREPDARAENQALLVLAEAMDEPQRMLQALVEQVVNVSHADSAGISVVEPGSSDTSRIRWHAIAGEHANHTDLVIPLEDSPCGLVMANQATMLFDRPQRHYPGLAEAEPPPVECLIVPFFYKSTPVGTLWGLTNRAGTHFDREDVRILEGLARFASAGFQLLQAMDVASTGQCELEQRVAERTAELRSANAALREVEQRFRLASDIESVGLITFTVDGEITWANNGFLKMSGYSREDLDAGRVRWDVMTPEEWMPQSNNALRELIEHGNTTPYEKMYIRKDGSRWWGLFAATRLSDDEGVEYIIDITESKEMESRLVASEELFRAIVSQTNVAIALGDLDGVVTFVNEGMTRMLGCSEYELTGKHFLDFTHPDEVEASRRSYSRLVADGIPFQCEKRYVRKDGSVCWVKNSVSPVRDAEGSVSSVVTLSVDISARVQAEEALRENERQLTDRVNKATTELRSLSRELLRVQEAERRHLAYELHDEIGQALTGLTFSLEMAKRGERREHLEHAEHITQSLLEQVRALTLELRPSVLDDMGLIPAFLELAERFPARTGVHVDLYHEGADRRFPTDIETVAYRVVQEALTNVARHSEAERATVRVVASDRLMIWISDEGQGFDIGAARAKGTYLGLAGMQERASLVGGNLVLDSATGEGTKIILELPLIPNDFRNRGD